MGAVDLEHLRSWIGRTRCTEDVISEAPVSALSATLNHDRRLAGPGQPLPPCWHWLYFLEHAATEALGEDGHPRRGDFLPPVPLPRRMWAGGRVSLHRPLRVGDRVRRDSTIEDVSSKLGRGGELLFVRVGHRVYCGTALALEETQNLVYREAGGGSPPADRQALPAADWSRQLVPDPLLLFRYSALTFNSHRIHYDRNYATGVEGYPSLVVQGPLTATLLLDLLYRERPGAQVKSFDFRGVRPLFEGQMLTLQGCARDGSVALWALDAAGSLAMQATAELD